MFQVVPPCGGHLGDFRPGIPGGQRFKSCPRVGGILDGSGEKLDELKFQVVPPCGGHRPRR